MFAKYLCVVLLIVGGCDTSRQASVENEHLPAAALRPIGRTSFNRDQHLELISSASSFSFRFEGTDCRITVAVPSWLSHNYLQYEVDGVYQGRIRVTSKQGEPVVISVPLGGRHTVQIYKATEAHTGPLIIQRIDGKRVRAIQPSSAPLIEFIGNSITCGAAADPSEVPCGTGVYHDQHNAYMAYGPRVARALKANFLLSAVSGYGVYRNWNSDGPSLPQVYEKTDFQEGSKAMWNFAAYSPRIVSIALGTNDFSRGDGKKQRLPFDSVKFVNAYADFVQLVKTKYPAAQIALLSSPMMNGEARAVLQNCLSAVKVKVDANHPGAKPVSLFFFQPMQARGCTGHPNVEDHRLIADVLQPFFRRLLR